MNAKELFKDVLNGLIATVVQQKITIDDRDREAIRLFNERNDLRTKLEKTITAHDNWADLAVKLKDQLVAAGIEPYVWDGETWVLPEELK